MTRRTRRITKENHCPWWIVAIMLIVIVVSVARAETYEIIPVESIHDCIIRADSNGLSQSVNQRWGTEPKIGWGCDGHERLCVKFDIPEYVDSCDTARFVIWGNVMDYIYGEPDSIDIGISPIVTAWDDSTVTWNDPWSGPGCSDFLLDADYSREIVTRVGWRLISWNNPQTGYVKIDITPIMKLWLDGTLGNHGILVRQVSAPTFPAGELYFHMQSSEAVDLLGWRVGCYFELFY